MAGSEREPVWAGRTGGSSREALRRSLVSGRFVPNARKGMWFDSTLSCLAINGLRSGKAIHMAKASVCQYGRASRGVVWETCDSCRRKMYKWVAIPSSEPRFMQTHLCMPCARQVSKAVGIADKERGT